MTSLRDPLRRQSGALALVVLANLFCVISGHGASPQDVPPVGSSDYSQRLVEQYYVRSSLTDFLKVDEAVLEQDSQTVSRYDHVTNALENQVTSLRDQVDKAKHLTPKLHDAVDVLFDKYLDQERNLRYFFSRHAASPSPKGQTIALAAIVTLAEQTKLLLDVSTRQAVKARLAESPKYRDRLIETTRWLVSSPTLDEIKKLAGAWEKNKGDIAQGREGFRYRRLAKSIENMGSLTELAQSGTVRQAWARVKTEASLVAIKVEFLVRRIVYAATKAFGNTMGMIRLAEPSLKKEDRAAAKAFLVSLLEPGDILIDKCTYKLTDRFIPGYFGHVAFWVGTEDQLRSHGLWTGLSPRMQKDVQAGRYIIEAVRDGVRASTLDQYLEIDTMVALRLRDAWWKPSKQEAIAKAFDTTAKLVGKPYDYSFDLNTREVVMCAEMVKTLLPETIDWPVEQTLWVASVRPDDFAGMAGPDPVFEMELVLMIKRGVPVHSTARYYRLWRDLIDSTYPMPTGKKGEVVEKILSSRPLFWQAIPDTPPTFDELVGTAGYDTVQAFAPTK